MSAATGRGVDLIGVPIDLGAGRRGVDMGPSAFRLTGLTRRIEALGRPVNDLGDVQVPIPEGRSPGEEILAALACLTAGLHLSLDLDGLDPEIAPGVGTPVRGGLSYREAHLLCEMIADTGRLAGIDVAELNPTLDLRNRTAGVGAELIPSALGQRI